MRSARRFLLVSLVAILPVTAFVIGDQPKSDAAKLTSVIVQDFEKPELKPEVWVVNIPGENAKVQLSADHPKEGKQGLKLHYHFLAGGNVQYLGIPNKTKIQAPVHQLHFMLYGDNSKCSYAVQISDASGETHQYGKSSGEGGVIDFEDWKEIAINLDVGHETWGGDKNNKLEYPITGITLIIGQPMENDKLLAAEGDLYFDALRVDSEKSVDETLGCQVAVVSPEYCSEVKGNTPIKLAAPGFKSVTVKCWKHGEKFGTDSTVAEVTLDAKGEGSFVFPADEYPHGPVMVRITGVNGAAKDNCYLQLYNRGGISWSEGIPTTPPTAAKGMKLVFEDDFTKLPTISGKNPKATYYDHKPPHGYQDFSVHVFTDHESPKTPFAQIDSYLRIRAADKTRTSGLISSMKNDGQGIKVSAPCYFEARFIGPNAIGTWPGFWLMTDYMTNYKLKGDKTPCDELDIIEAYGGEGPGSPNAYDTYMTTPHCWNQGDVGKELETKAFKAMHNPIRMKKFGIPSTWFEAFHIYGCKITKTETIYYCDDIEVARHETLPLSKEQPLFFMINLATGGGWPVDLSRYNGTTDMYIDYVRVYQE
jgi:hypothetical protein